jgi:hypothetical protein
LTPTLTVLLRLRLLRTCFSIQARRLVRLLCSDSTIRGHGLHSAMSRAAMAIARPTCGESSLIQHLGPLIKAAILGCGTQPSRREEGARPKICSVGTLTSVPRLFISSRLIAVPYLTVHFGAFIHYEEQVCFLAGTKKFSQQKFRSLTCSSFYPSEVSCDTWNHQDHSREGAFKAQE